MDESPSQPLVKPRPVKPWGGAAAGIGILAPAAVGMILAWFLPGPWAFLAMTASVYALIGVLGKALTGSFLGALVDECNMMSLARFQTAVWTGIVLGGFIVVAFSRLAALIRDPLDITVPQELWAVLGISATSLVGTPLVGASKRTQAPGPGVVEKTAAQLGESPDQMHHDRQGTLYANTDIHDARIADMFQGDEVGNTAQVDLAKVQMFYFTVLTAAAYALAIWNQLGHRAMSSSLPELSAGAVALLGISHGGYLVNRAVDHSSASSAQP